MSQRGRQLGDYVLEERLGAGGMGEVYRARQVDTGAVRALKLIGLGAGDELITRFEREGEALARVNHPQVIRVHACVRAEGALGLVMAFCPGGDLDQRLRKSGPLEADEAARLVAGLAQGLSAAHAVGVLHRDLKPANVLYGEDGQAVLSDFGLAKVVDRSSLTATGELLGTPSYMAPEQAIGGAVDERTDVYGLGAILYAALTARPPFAAASALLVLDQVVREAPPAPSEVAPQVPASLDAICGRALAKDPQERFASASELGQALERYLAGERQGAAPSLARGAALLLVLGVVALGVALGTRAGGPAQSAASPRSASPAPTRPGSPVARPSARRSGRSGLPALLPARLPGESHDPSPAESTERLAAFARAAPVLAHGYRLFEPARYWTISNQDLLEGRYVGASSAQGRVDHQDLLERYLALARRGRLVGWRRLSLHFRGEGGRGPHVDDRLSERIGFNLISWRDPVGLIGAAQAAGMVHNDLPLAFAFLALVDAEQLERSDLALLEGVRSGLGVDEGDLPAPQVALRRLREHEQVLVDLPFAQARWSAWFAVGREGKHGLRLRRRQVRRVMAELISRQPVLQKLYARVLAEEAFEGEMPKPRAVYYAQGEQQAVLRLTRILRGASPMDVCALAVWVQAAGHDLLGRALAALAALTVLGESDLKVVNESAPGRALKANSWPRRGALCEAALVAAGAYQPLPGMIVDSAASPPAAMALEDSLGSYCAELALRNHGLRKPIAAGHDLLVAHPQGPERIAALLELAAQATAEDFGPLVALALAGDVGGAKRLGLVLGARRPRLGLCFLHTALANSGSFTGRQEVVQRELLTALHACYERYASRDEPAVARILGALKRLQAQEPSPGSADEDWETLRRAHQHLRRSQGLPHGLGLPPLLDEL